MPTEIILPKVDMDMATGRISRWYVAEGGAVTKGEVLFEIETDKAAMEIDAPVSGTLVDITGREGVDIAVGARVALILEAGEAPTHFKTQLSDAQPSGSTVSVESSMGATGALSIRVEADAMRDASADAGTAGIRATPLARRLCRERGIDIARVQGSGPHGRILRADIDAFEIRPEIAAPMTASTQPLPEPRQSAASAGSDAVLKLFAEGSYEMVAHDSMRRTIARRLVEAKSTIPHFYLSAQCEIDELMALRAKLNAAAANGAGEPAYRLSLNDMVIKALALALRDVPDANVTWTEEGMLRHRQVDVGVAVSVPGGLITPIVRNAQAKTLSVISNEMKDLAVRARGRRLKAEEYQGGTTAISNLGMFGVEAFSAIVNPPHASILAVGAGERRPVARGDAVVVATVMTVTLSTDHRAIDGALAAQLLGAFRRYIEDPYLMLV